jgi:hypothetical protein
MNKQIKGKKCYPVLGHRTQKKKYKVNSIKHNLNQHKTLLNRKVRKKRKWQKERKGRRREEGGKEKAGKGREGKGREGKERRNLKRCGLSSSSNTIKNSYSINKYLSRYFRMPVVVHPCNPSIQEAEAEGSRV